MSFLNNRDLELLYQNGVRPIRHPDQGDRTTLDSLIVQAAKIDLRVGQVHVPGSGARHSRRRHSLASGGAALVETLEDVAMPRNMIGLMFPKSGEVAQRGVLITNFGHVDPGYLGKLTYTVINMSTEPFDLIHGEALASIMLYDMRSEASPGWRGYSTSLADLARDTAIPREFLNLSIRIKARVIPLVLQTLAPALLLTVVLTLLAAAGTSALTYYSFSIAVGTPRERVLEDKVAALKAELDKAALEKRVSVLEDARTHPAPLTRTGLRP